MQKITHTYLAAIKATETMQNIACGEGLTLRVSPKGKKTWYLRYDTVTSDGKRKQNIVSMGDFPALSLKEARLQADERKALAKDGNTNLAKAKKQAILHKAQETSASDFACFHSLATCALLRGAPFGAFRRTLGRTRP